MLKIALDAGHGKNTAGKRCLKSLDSKETREWVLNARIAEFIEAFLFDYKDVDVLRVDDPTGKTDISLTDRCNKANKWGADIYISLHHNAGINGGKGGGIVVFRYPGSSLTSKALITKLYNKLIDKTGLKGNRANPVTEADFHVLRETEMRAILVEHGFMDSPTDIKQILKEDFAIKCAKAHVEFLAEEYNLKKKPEPVKETKKEVKPSGNNTGWRVVIGYYEDYDNALKAVEEAKKKGFKSAFLAEHKKS